jgi:hypothetical protein
MLPPLRIYIEGEKRQATYRLNCSGEFTRARFGHSEVFEKMTNEWPSLLAPRGQNPSFYYFWKNVFSLTSTKKLLAKPGNVGNLAIKWCDFLHGRFTLWRQGGCWSVFGYLRYKGILCIWLTCYGLQNKGICNSRLFWLLLEGEHPQHDDLYMFWYQGCIVGSILKYNFL